MSATDESPENLQRAEEDVLALMHSWPSIPNSIHVTLAARCWGASMIHGLRAMADWLEHPDPY